MTQKKLNIHCPVCHSEMVDPRHSSQDKGNETVRCKQCGEVRPMFFEVKA